MIAEADGDGAPNPNGGMPGQLHGEVGVLDFEQDVADHGPIVGGAEGDGSDDEADIEVREGTYSSSHLPEAGTRPPLAAPRKDPTQHRKPLPRRRSRRSLRLLRQRRWWEFGSSGSGLGYR